LPPPRRRLVECLVECIQQSDPTTIHLEPHCKSVESFTTTPDSADTRDGSCDNSDAHASDLYGQFDDMLPNVSSEHEVQVAVKAVVADEMVLPADASVEKIKKPKLDELSLQNCASVTAARTRSVRLHEAAVRVATDRCQQLEVEAETKEKLLENLRDCAKRASDRQSGLPVSMRRSCEKRIVSFHREAESVEAQLKAILADLEAERRRMRQLCEERRRSKVDVHGAFQLLQKLRGNQLLPQLRSEQTYSRTAVVSPRS